MDALTMQCPRQRRRTSAFVLHVAELALLVGAGMLSLFHGVLVTFAAAEMEGLLQIRRVRRCLFFTAHMAIAACLDRTLTFIGMVTGAALDFLQATHIFQPGMQLVVESDIPQLSREHNDVLIGRNLATDDRK
jgi:hypothetical protein